MALFLGDTKDWCATACSQAVRSGNVVNEIVSEYDDLGLVSREYQEHEGAKDGNTLYVQYNRDTTAASGEYTKGLRLTSVRYPNARLVHYTYSTSGTTPDAMSRLDAINDDNSGSPGDSLAEYDYLGRGTIVVEDFVEPDVKLNYDSGTPGEYAGFDRFGRIIDQLWYDYGASANRDQFTYGYDRVSNRLYRENTGTSGLDEFYTYDDMNRLATADRGDLNVGKDAITGTPGWEEDWSLDMTGNWSDYIQKTSGNTDLDQERTHNEVNELTNITETTGTAWITPVQDKNGNMTTVPKPSSLANGLTCEYDAWNRLVEVKDGLTVIGRYEYDAQNRRTKRHLDTDSPDSPDGIDTYVHYFYTATWQTLETRVTTTESDQPESLQPQYQYVWSPRYIDSPIFRDENTDEDSLCDDQRLYHLSDANYNITVLADVGGDAVERYVYDPHGRATIYDATWQNTRATSSYDNELTFAGREYDEETGLHCNRARHYSAQLGRFLSRDPAGYKGSWVALYGYVSNNPIIRTDPSGKFAAAEDMPGLLGPIGYDISPPEIVDTLGPIGPFGHSEPLPGLIGPIGQKPLEEPVGCTSVPFSIADKSDCGVFWLAGHRVTFGYEITNGTTKITTCPTRCQDGPGEVITASHSSYVKVTGNYRKVFGLPDPLRIGLVVGQIEAHIYFDGRGPVFLGAIATRCPSSGFRVVGGSGCSTIRVIGNGGGRVRARVPGFDMAVGGFGIITAEVKLCGSVDVINGSVNITSFANVGEISGGAHLSGYTAYGGALFGAAAYKPYYNCFFGDCCAAVPGLP